MATLRELTDTWNSGATTFTGLGLDVTDTASAAGSFLINLKVGGVSKFSVQKGGIMDVNSVEFRPNYGGAGRLRVAGSGGFFINPSVEMQFAVPLTWSGSTAGDDASDTGLGRNSAGVIEINNGTPGTFRDLKVRNITAASVVFTGSGIFDVGTGVICVGNNPLSDAAFAFYTSSSGSARAIRMNGTGIYQWAGTSPDGAADTGLSRASGGVVEVNNGTPGTLRTISAVSLSSTTGASQIWTFGPNSGDPYSYALRLNGDVIFSTNNAGVFGATTFAIAGQNFASGGFGTITLAGNTITCTGTVGGSSFIPNSTQSSYGANALVAGTLRMASTTSLEWSSGTNPADSADTKINRVDEGIVEIGSGSGTVATGFILKSPAGTRYLVTVSDLGVLTTTEVV